jgi:hypothetical protein
VLPQKEGTSGEVTHQAFVDQSARKLEFVQLLGEWQTDTGRLVFDRARPPLSERQLADDV